MKINDEIQGGDQWAFYCERETPNLFNHSYSMDVLMNELRGRITGNPWDFIKRNGWKIVQVKANYKIIGIFTNE